MFEKLRCQIAVMQLTALMVAGNRGTRRSLHRSQSGKLTAANVGYGLAVGGAIMALAALVGIIFVPVATFPVVDAEMAAFLGAILLVAGIFVHAAD